MAKKRKYSKKQEVDPEEEDLDRFAGSSDEEEGDAVTTTTTTTTTTGKDEAAVVNYDPEDGEDVSEDDDELVPMKAPTKKKRSKKKKVDDDDESDEDEDQVGVNNDDDDDDDDDDEMGTFIDADVGASAKMADAMSRILGTTAKASASSVVLSKTKTPLQRLQAEEKEKMKALRNKRKATRERNLTALHIPLSVATTNTIQSEGRLSVAKELEQERLHRRVATRGVVALFNAIQQHQRGADDDDDFDNRKKKTAKMTKHSFLDKIKTAATTNSPAEETERKSAKSDAPNWNALKDDYLMKPKKNWDQESSSDEEDEDTDFQGGETVDMDEALPPSPPAEKASSKNKKRRVGAR